MKFLHTSDWHIGKQIRGRSRDDEHRAVLNEIATIADDHEVDAVLVGGDVYETKAPNPESEKIAYETLMRMAKDRPVVVIAGNHDNAKRFTAVTPLLEIANVTVLSQPSLPDEGGVVTLESESRSEAAKIALLPFVSHTVMKNLSILDGNRRSRSELDYATGMANLIELLCADMQSDTVNLCMAHAMTPVVRLGGGERSAHTGLDYCISCDSLPAALQYVALGHVHRAQEVKGNVPVHYCGSPLQMDFGETTDVKGVNIVEASPGKPAEVSFIPLQSGKKLVQVTCRLDDLEESTKGLDDVYLLVTLNEKPRHGLADEVRERVEGVLDVRILGTEERTVEKVPIDTNRAPQVLFHEYLSKASEDDKLNEDVEKLFAELLEESLET